MTGENRLECEQRMMLIEVENGNNIIDFQLVHRTHCVRARQFVCINEKCGCLLFKFWLCVRTVNLYSDGRGLNILIHFFHLFCFYYFLSIWQRGRTKIKFIKNKERRG